MADLQRIETALRNADAAGDVEAARQLAAAYKQARAEQSAPVQQEPAASPPLQQNPSLQVDTGRKKPALPQYSRPLESIRSGLRGLTVGTSDVLGAGAAAGLAAAGGADFGEAYKDIKTELSSTRDAYRTEHPVESFATEIGGAVAPMALAGPLGAVGVTSGAGRVAPVVNALSKVGARATSLPLVGGLLKATGQGMVLGGTYGASQADVGNELAGGGLGAVTGGAAQYGLNKVIGGVGKLVGAAQEKGKQIANEYLSGNASNIYNTVKVTLQQKGIDFEKLGADVQKDVMDYAARAMANGEAPQNAVALANQAVLNKLPEPIKATAGTLNRDFIQQEKEGLLATGSPMFGQEVRQTLESYAPSLAKNLELIRAKTGGADVSKGQIGKGAQQFTEKAAKKSMEKVRGLYGEAEQVAGQNIARVDDNVLGWIAENKGTTGVDPLINKAKNIGALREAVDQEGKKILDASGNPVLEAGDVTLKRLYDLRSAASIESKAGGTAGHRAKEFKLMIDDIIERNGGDLYKAAAQARRAHALQFESGPRVISDMLVGKARSETDRAMNFDSVVDNVVLSGSRGADDIKKLYSFMVKDPETRAEGLQQIKNIRGATLDHIYEMATSGQAKFSPAALNKAIKGIGGIEKLEQILGKQGAAELKNFQQAADILLNKEKSVLPNSATAGRLAMMAESVFGKLKDMPAGIGTTATVAQKGIQSLGNARAAKNAMMPVNTGEENLSKIGANALLDTRAAAAARKAAVVASKPGDSQQSKTYGPYKIVGRTEDGRPIYEGIGELK